MAGKAGRAESHRLGLRLMLAFLLCAGTLLGVGAYSSARVNNEATLTVVDSKDALIAVDVGPAVIEWGENEAWCGNRGNSARCGRMTNNMSETIDLILSGDGCRFRLDDGSGEDLNSLVPGQSADLYIKIDGPKEGVYKGLIMARWSNGTAEIPFEAPVEVIGLGNSGAHVSAGGCGLSASGAGGGPVFPLPPAEPAGTEQDNVSRDNDSVDQGAPGDGVSDSLAGSGKASPSAAGDSAGNGSGSGAGSDPAPASDGGRDELPANASDNSMDEVADVGGSSE